MRDYLAVSLDGPDLQDQDSRESIKYIAVGGRLIVFSAESGTDTHTNKRDSLLLTCG